MDMAKLEMIFGALAEQNATLIAEQKMTNQLLARLLSGGGDEFGCDDKSGFIFDDVSEIRVDLYYNPNNVCRYQVLFRKKNPAAQKVRKSKKSGEMVCNGVGVMTSRSLIGDLKCDIDVDSEWLSHAISNIKTGANPVIIKLHDEKHQDVYDVYIIADWDDHTISLALNVNSKIVVMTGNMVDDNKKPNKKWRIFRPRDYVVVGDA